MSRAGRLLLKGALVAFDTIAKAHHVVSRTPLIGVALERIEDTVLDSILGPAEDHDYVSTTAPSSPPPRS